MEIRESVKMERWIEIRRKCKNGACGLKFGESVRMERVDGTIRRVLGIA